MKQDRRGVWQSHPKILRPFRDLHCIQSIPEFLHGGSCLQTPPKLNPGRQMELSLVPVFATGPETIIDNHHLPLPTHILDFPVPQQWVWAACLPTLSQGSGCLVALPSSGCDCSLCFYHSQAWRPKRQLSMFLSSDMLPTAHNVCQQPQLFMGVRANYFHWYSNPFLCLLINWQGEPGVTLLLS